MRIFLTGGEGQLGRALAATLVGHELYLGSHEKEDITDRRIVETVSAFRPDVVIHTAAATDVDACEANSKGAFLVNEQGTRFVARGAQNANALMIYLSTDYVFDGSKSRPYLETDPTHPVNVYGTSKLAGERAAQEEARRWLIVRTSWIYGGGRKDFVTSVLEWAKTQSVLRLVHDKTGSPTYATELAQAISFLINKGVCNRIYHISGEGGCTWFEYGREILRLAGIQKKLIPISFEELKRPAKRPPYSVLEKAALRKSGFAMRPWSESLKDYLEKEK